MTLRRCWTDRNDHGFPFDLKMKSISTYSLLFFIMLLSIGGEARAFEIAEQDARVDRGNVWNAAAKIALRAPGEMPVFSEDECGRLQRLGPPEKSSSEPDTVAVASLVGALDNKHTKILAAVLPETLVGWLRRQTEVSFLSLTVASHESNHALDNSLSACNQGRRTFYFKGAVWPSELVRGDSPGLSVAASYIPERFRETAVTSRYSKYLIQSVEHANDFSSLMGEFNAYTATASLELELATTPLFASFKKSGITSFDGNVGGMIDMMLFSLAYLKYVEEHPASFAKLKVSPLLLAHMQRLWTESENVLCAAVPYSKAYGGILVISNDKLETIYSDKFISILDRLGIKHFTNNQAKKCMSPIH